MTNCPECDGPWSGGPCKCGWAPAAPPTSAAKPRPAEAKPWELPLCAHVSQPGAMCAPCTAEVAQFRKQFLAYGERIAGRIVTAR